MPCDGPTRAIGHHPAALLNVRSGRTFGPQGVLQVSHVGPMLSDSAGEGQARPRFDQIRRTLTDAAPMRPKPGRSRPTCAQNGPTSVEAGQAWPKFAKPASSWSTPARGFRPKFRAHQPQCGRCRPESTLVQHWPDFSRLRTNSNPESHKSSMCVHPPKARKCRSGTMIDQPRVHGRMPKLVCGAFCCVEGHSSTTLEFRHLGLCAARCATYVGYNAEAAMHSTILNRTMVFARPGGIQTQHTSRKIR